MIIPWDDGMHNIEFEFDEGVLISMYMVRNGRRREIWVKDYVQKACDEYNKNEIAKMEHSILLGCKYN